jgi:predicted nucleic acid-binding OB-fold protein
MRFHQVIVTSGSSMTNRAITSKEELQKVLDNTVAEDNHTEIELFQNSVKIKKDMQTFQTLLSKDPLIKQNMTLLRKECSFTFQAYPDIFQKIIQNDAGQLVILHQMLTSLELIEKKKKSQHEASVIVGRILQKKYVQ